MKILTLILFLLGTFSGLGATPKTGALSESQEFVFDDTTCLFSSLGFGDYDRMVRFGKSQITCAVVGIFQENGSGSFNNETVYQFLKDSETFDGFVLRISNEELQRSVVANHYRLNQKFSLRFYFKNEAQVSQFWTRNTTFTPIIGEGVPYVPEEAFYGIELNLQSGAGGTLMIAWPLIKRASLVVYDKTGSLCYVGDTKDNGLNDHNFWALTDDSLVIGRRFLTNECTGILTVASFTGSSQTYAINGGYPVFYPEAGTPLIGTKMNSNGKFVVSVVGGTPLQNISIKAFKSLSLPPTEIPLTLDIVGSASWTNNLSSPTGFFSFGQ